MKAADFASLLRGIALSGIPECLNMPECEFYTDVKATGLKVRLDRTRVMLGSKEFITFSPSAQAAVSYDFHFGKSRTEINAQLRECDCDLAGVISVAPAILHLTEGVTHTTSMAIVARGSTAAQGTLEIRAKALSSSKAEVTTRFGREPVQLALQSTDSMLRTSDVSILLNNDGFLQSDIGTLTLSSKFRGSMNANAFSATLDPSALSIACDKISMAVKALRGTCAITGSLSLALLRLRLLSSSVLDFENGKVTTFAVDMVDGILSRVVFAELAATLASPQTIVVNGMKPIMLNAGRLSSGSVVLNSDGEIGQGALRLEAKTASQNGAITVTSEVSSSYQEITFGEITRTLHVGANAVELRVKIYLRVEPNGTSLFVDMSHPRIVVAGSLRTGDHRTPKYPGAVFNAFEFAPSITIPGEELKHMPIISGATPTAGSLTIDAKATYTLSIPRLQEVATDIFFTLNHDGECRAHWYVDEQTLAADITVQTTFGIDLEGFALSASAKIADFRRFVPSGRKLTGCPEWNPGMKGFVKYVGVFFVPNEILRTMGGWDVAVSITK
jgi:hypothetical protein